MLLYVGDDWNEGDHPRKKDGEFAPKGGGESGGGGEGGEGGGGELGEVSSTPIPKGKFKPTPKVSKLLKEKGFSKVKGTDYPTYYHPNGVKVVLHPVSEYQAQTNKFSIEHPTGLKSEGQYGSKLKKLLHYIPSAVEHNLSQAPGAGASPVQATGLAQTPAKAAPEPGKAAPSPVSTQASPPPPAKPPSDPQGKAAYNAAMLKGIQDLGYVYSHELSKAAEEYKGDTQKLIFMDKNGAKVQYEPESGKWLSQKAYHGIKTGYGAHNLKALLTGQPVTYQGGEPAWTNTSETILTMEQVESQKAEHLYNSLLELAPQATANQQHHIQNYSGSGYQSLNQALRHDPEMAAHSASVAAIDSYLKDATLPQDAVLYRGVKGEYAKILKSIIFKGSTFIDRGYVSTSTKKSTASNFESGLLFKIKVPAGTKGAAIGKFSHHSTENEVLLPRNTAFKVTAYDPKKGTVEVEPVQNHEEFA